MLTEVVMKRELFGKEISQKSKSEFFSATDIVRAGNIWRIGQGLQPFNMIAWLQQKGTKEFIKALDSQFGKVLMSGKGRGSHTWVHPYLFIDMALAISPELKIEVYSWIHDTLLKYRNDSGDSYKKMAGALYLKCSNKSLFPKEIMSYAEQIKKACNVGSWETAKPEQLELRNKIHDYIALLSDLVPNADAVRIAIKRGVSEWVKNQG